MYLIRKGVVAHGLNALAASSTHTIQITKNSRSTLVAIRNRSTIDNSSTTNELDRIVDIRRYWFSHTIRHRIIHLTSYNDATHARCIMTANSRSIKRLYNVTRLDTEHEAREYERVLHGR